MPSAADIARLGPSTAAVRSTSAVSIPGVIVSNPAAKLNASSACAVVNVYVVDGERVVRGSNFLCSIAKGCKN
jgi:hypothetical protein